MYVNEIIFCVRFQLIPSYQNVPYQKKINNKVNTLYERSLRLVQEDGES